MTDQDKPYVRYEVSGGAATITLDSPHNRNAISTRLVTELQAGLTSAAADPAVRAVVLTHTGGTFCAGADLSEALRFVRITGGRRQGARTGDADTLAQHSRASQAGDRADRRSRPGRRHGSCRGVRHRRRRTGEHLRGDGITVGFGGVHHFAHGPCRGSTSDLRAAICSPARSSASTRPNPSDSSPPRRRTRRSRSPNCSAPCANVHRRDLPNRSGSRRVRSWLDSTGTARR